MRELTVRSDAIDDVYESLGHQWGWSFLAGPESQLYEAETVIVGLNPARAKGDRREDYGGPWDVPEGKTSTSIDDGAAATTTAGSRSN